MKKDGKACYSHDSTEFFKIYLDQTCSTRLRIPPIFVKKFNGDVPQTFTLEGPEGRSWCIVASKVDEYFFFQDGWPKFVQDNSLEDADFLTFCYGGCSKFYVKIYGKHGCRKEVAGLGRNGPIEQLHGKSNRTCTTPRAPFSRTHSSGSKISHAVKAQDRLRYKCATFTVRLSKTYVGDCMNLPMDFCKSYIREKWANRPKAILLTQDKHEERKNRPKAILQTEDKQWDVGIAKCGGERYQLRKGWAQFVKENSLQEGDRCIFQLIDNNDDIVLKVATLKSPA